MTAQEGAGHSAGPGADNPGVVLPAGRPPLPDVAARTHRSRTGGLLVAVAVISVLTAAITATTASAQGGPGGGGGGGGGGVAEAAAERRSRRPARSPRS